MQVDCYKRNWNSDVCIPKCKFYGECLREYWRKRNKCDVVVVIQGRKYQLCKIKNGL